MTIDSDTTADAATAVGLAHLERRYTTVTRRRSVRLGIASLSLAGLYMAVSMVLWLLLAGAMICAVGCVLAAIGEHVASRDASGGPDGC